MSTSDQILCADSSDTGKKWRYSGMVHQTLMDLKIAYDSVRREVLYNILIELGIL
jgi:hypothetical protein